MRPLELPVAGCTISSKSHLASARVVARSFQRHNPGVPFFVLLADEVDGWFDPEQETFSLIRLSDLSGSSIEPLSFRYPQQPFTYASTPFLLAHLLDRGLARVVFVNQERMVHGDLRPLFSSDPTVGGGQFPMTTTTSSAMFL